VRICPETIEMQGTFLDGAVSNLFGMPSGTLKAVSSDGFERRLPDHRPSSSSSSSSPSRFSPGSICGSSSSSESVSSSKSESSSHGSPPPPYEANSLLFCHAPGVLDSTTSLISSRVIS